MARRKTFQELSFTDDFMFCKVLESDPDLCRRILEMILDIRIREVRFKNKQQIIEPNPDRKSIRLDVLVDDENNSVYDLEMQTQNKKELSRRSRCYQSVMDVDTLRRGGNYKELPDSYIVFICSFDPVGAGLPKYTFRELCEEDPSIELQDGIWKVFVNCKSKDRDISAEMRAFLDYLCGLAPESDLTQDIDDRINFVKNNKVWEIEYMHFIDYFDDVADDAREEGYAEGLAEARAESVEKLVHNSGMSIEEACRLLELPIEEYYKHKKDEPAQ